jgi:hypothetical protein
MRTLRILAVTYEDLVAVDGNFNALSVRLGRMLPIEPLGRTGVFSGPCTLPHRPHSRCIPTKVLNEEYCYVPVWDASTAKRHLYGRMAYTDFLSDLASRWLTSPEMQIPQGVYKLPDFTLPLTSWEDWPRAHDAAAVGSTWNESERVVKWRPQATSTRTDRPSAEKLGKAQAMSKIQFASAVLSFANWPRVDIRLIIIAAAVAAIVILTRRDERWVNPAAVGIALATLLILLLF